MIVAKESNLIYLRMSKLQKSEQTLWVNIESIDFSYFKNTVFFFWIKTHSLVERSNGLLSSQFQKSRQLNTSMVIKEESIVIFALTPN